VVPEWNEQEQENPISYGIDDDSWAWVDERSILPRAR